MKKRNLLVASLILLGATTIAGTGFASWYFQNSVNASSQNVNVYVTNKHVASASMTLTAPGQLNMDDPEFGNGLRWMTDNNQVTTITAVVTPSVSGDTTGASGYTMDFKLTITLPGEISTYVVFNTDDISLLSTSNSSTAGTSTGGVTASTTNEVVYELKGLSTATQTITLDIADLVKYTTTVESSTGTRASSFTEDNYDTMSTALSGKHIAVKAELEYNTVATGE